MRRHPDRGDQPRQVDQATPIECAGRLQRGEDPRFKPGRQGKGFEKRWLKLEAREAKAKAAGHTKRAAHLAKMIAHYGSHRPASASTTPRWKPQIGIPRQAAPATDQRRSLSAPIPWLPGPAGRSG